jgi:hypothetical protein
MTEIWSKQYLDHISVISCLIGLFLGSFWSLRVWRVNPCSSLLQPGRRRASPPLPPRFSPATSPPCAQCRDATTPPSAPPPSSPPPPPILSHMQATDTGTLPPPPRLPPTTSPQLLHVRSMRPLCPTPGFAPPRPHTPGFPHLPHHLPSSPTCKPRALAHSPSAPQATLRHLPHLPHMRTRGASTPPPPHLHPPGSPHPPRHPRSPPTCKLRAPAHSPSAPRATPHHLPPSPHMHTRGTGTPSPPLPPAMCQPPTMLPHPLCVQTG